MLSYLTFHVRPFFIAVVTLSSALELLYHRNGSSPLRIVYSSGENIVSSFCSLNHKCLNASIVRTIWKSFSSIVGSVVECRVPWLWSTWSRFKTYSRDSIACLRKTPNGTFPVWWSWQAVLNFCHISIKIKNKIKISIGQQYLGISGSRSG